VIRALIVDDEAPARRKLERLLQAAPGVEVVGEAADGSAAVRAIRSARPDVVFLDVRMPGLDGFGVIREVGIESMPPVVFVTAYDEHAVEAFEVQALDYLLKPVTPSRFRNVLERVRARLRLPPDALFERLGALLARAGEPRYLERILVQKDGRGRLIPVGEIDRIEAARNYVLLHSGGSVHLLRRPIGALAERLDPARFLRLSRSEIVRLDAVGEFQAWFHGDRKVILKDGTELVWSRRFRGRLARDGDLD
jgi:two-component system, LytTR family, response regulator